MNRNRWMATIFVLLALVLPGLVLSTCGCGRSETASVNAAVQATMLDGYWYKVQACAQDYATEKGLLLLRIERPKVVIVRTEEELIAIKREELPKYKRPPLGKKLCGLCSYRKKTLFVLGMDYEVLAHEYGHWYFGPSCDVAEDFEKHMAKFERR